MGTASLVLGIVSIIIGIVPFCGVIALIPALIGLILGAIDVEVKRKENKGQGQAIAGVILTIIAILFIGGYFVISIYTSENKNEIKLTNSSATQTTNKVYNVGQPVKIGKWQITVLGAEDKKTLENGYSKKTTENNYIVVKMQIKNLSNEAATPLTTATQVTSSSVGFYTKSEFELYDGKSSYIADYNLEGYVNDNYSIMFNKINPNTSITYNAVFETDKTSDKKEYKLRLDSNKNILLKIK